MIHTIFNLVDIDYEPHLILNKRLLPFYRSRLYRSVHFVQYSKLAKFVRTLVDNPSIGSYVEALDMWFIHSDLEEGMESWDVYTSYEVGQFAKALPALVNLRELKIWGSSTIVRSILDQDLATACPKLQEIKLESAFKGFKHIFDRSNFVNLAGYHQLRKLVISEWRSERNNEEDDNRDAQEISDRSTHPSLSLPSRLYLPFVDDLLLHGSFPSVRAAHQILECFRPTKLRVHPSDPSSISLRILLETIPYPQIITHLTIGSYSNDFGVGSSLLRFASLTSLTLESFSPIDSPAFNHAIRRLPLTHLKYSYLSNPACQELISLISPRTKHPTLQTLEISTIRGEVGTYLGIQLEDGKMVTDWTVPGIEVYTTGFRNRTLDLFVFLRKIATRSGIETTGTSFECIELADQFVKKFRLVRKAYKRWRNEKGKNRRAQLKEGRLDTISLKRIACFV